MDKTYALDELAALSGLSRRTVRYYVQLGLADRPEGGTRAAYYTARHLEQLVRIRKWTDAGVSLERIRELIAGTGAPVPPRPRQAGSVEVWAHIAVADGVEVMLESGRAGLSPEEVRAFHKGVVELYGRVKRKGKKHA